MLLTEIIRDFSFKGEAGKIDCDWMFSSPSSQMFSPSRSAAVGQVVMAQHHVQPWWPIDMQIASSWIKTHSPSDMLSCIQGEVAYIS